MATTGATLITALATRLRDAGSTAHARTLLLRVLSHSQRIVNRAHRLEKATVSFTPNTGRAIFTIAQVASDVARIERIIDDDDRTLPEVSWDHLLADSPTWYRDTTSRHRVWARLGGNLFVLTPRALTALPVSVVYTIVPPDVTDDATNVTLADEWLPLVMDIAESIMLLKARIYAPLEATMARIAASMVLKPPFAPVQSNS